MTSQKLKPYIVSVLLVLCVGLLKVGLAHWFHLLNPFLLFFSVVMISAWYGGGTQGVFSMILSMTFTTFWLRPPAWTLDEMITRYLLFAVDGLFISFLCEMLHRSNEKSQRSEEFLKTSENRLRKVFESNMIGLIFTDENGDIIDANSYFLTMLGYDKASFTPGCLNWRELTVPNFSEISQKMHEKTKAQNFIQPYEKEYYRKDGTRVAVLVGSARIDSKTIVSFILDMTARQKSSQAIHEAYEMLENRVEQRTRELMASRTFLDSVVENIPNMIFVKDAKNLQFLRINKAGEDLLGFSRRDLIGKSDYDFFPQDQADFFVEQDRHVLAAGRVIDIPDEPIQTKVGLRSIHTKKIPLRNKEGEVEYLLGISEDITEKKESDKQKLIHMQEQTTRLEIEKTAARLDFLAKASAVLGESLDISTMLESFGQFVVSDLADWCSVHLLSEKTNKMERKVIAYKSDVEQAKWKEWKTYFPTEGESNWFITQRIYESGEPRLINDITDEDIKKEAKNQVQAEYIKRLDIGSIVFAPLKSFGKVIGVLVLGRSKSEKPYGELDLSMAQDLSKRVSYSLENARLYSKAQEASQAKSAFLANMSHEIRTPLGAMLGFAELMDKNENLTEDQNSFVTTIIRNGNRLLHIVDEILDLSKVESQAITIESIGFSLKHLVEEVKGLLSIQASSKNLNFDFELSDNLPDRIVSDPTRIRQILINVIGNSIKFTDRGEVKVKVRALSQVEGSTLVHLEFEVIDTGIGISEAQKNNLFQAFTQADDSMTRRFGGTGLGLILSKKLAKLLDGDLFLKESTFNVGSTFVIHLQVFLDESDIQTNKYIPLGNEAEL